MVATLDELDEAALISILTEPKNALTKQYRRLFDMEGAELEFRDEALRAVARNAPCSARPARAACAPSSRTCCSTRCTSCPRCATWRKVVVDETVIEGQTKPYVVYVGRDRATPRDGFHASLRRSAASLARETRGP